MKFLGFEIKRIERKKAFIAICEDNMLPLSSKFEKHYVPITTYGYSIEDVEKNWEYKKDFPIVVVFLKSSLA